MEKIIYDIQDISRLLVEKFHVTDETAMQYAPLLVNYRQYNDNIRYTDEDWIIRSAIDYGIEDDGPIKSNPPPPSGLKDSQFQTVNLASLVPGYNINRLPRQSIAAMKFYGDKLKLAILKEHIKSHFEHKKVIFHGYRYFNDLLSHLIDGFSVSRGPHHQPNELGSGYYCTPSIEYALNWIETHKGVIAIFQWDDVDLEKDGVVRHYLNGKQWQIEVKRNVCVFDQKKIQEIGGPTLFRIEFDVLEAPVAENYSQIIRCFPPKQSGNHQTVLIRRVDDILRKRLVGLIYLY